MMNYPMRILMQSKNRLSAPVGFVISILFTMNSCVSREARDTELTETDVENVSVKSEPIVGQAVAEIYQRNAKMLGIIDTVLLVIDRSEEPLLTFYSLRSLKCLGQYGNIGNDSWEYQNLWYYGQYFYENDSLFFFLVDSERGRFMKLNLLNILDNIKAEPVWSYVLPSDLFHRHSSIVMTKDSILFGSYLGRRIVNTGGQRAVNTGRFFRYDISNKDLSWSEYYPHTEKISIHDQELSYYYYSFISYNPDKEIFAASMSYFKRVDFVNSDFLKLNSVTFKSFKDQVPDSRTPASSFTIQFYNGSFGGERYFYTFCINGHVSKYVSDTGNIELHVFLWNGELVKIVKLDRMYLGYFVVDERSEDLFVINHGKDSEANPILRYSLSGLGL
jgi:hypothetical protein